MIKRYRKKRRIMLAGLLAFSFLLSGCASQLVAVDKTDQNETGASADSYLAYQINRVDSGSAPMESGAAMPEIYFQDEAGKELSLGDCKGKVVVLNFWASWCPPCKAEMPDFEELYQQWDPEKIVLLTINITDGQRETKKLAQEHMQKNGYAFPVLFDDELLASAIYAAYSIPMTYVIRPDGRLEEVIVGKTDKDTLQKIVAAAAKTQ